MIAHIPAAASRPPGGLSDSIGDRESSASGWAVRLVRICLAIYLIPVLLVMVLVGGVGVVVLGVAKLATLIRAAWEPRNGGFPL